MIELIAVFWFAVVLFGVIGAIRGWVREIQATAAAILGMFIIEQISPFVWTILVERTPIDMLTMDPLGTLRRLVMFKAAILLIIIFFGYQGPLLIQSATSRRTSANKPRETIQEGFLGALVGAANGYLIIGALWWYVHVAQYPFDWIISPLNFPESASAAFIAFLPLAWMSSPWLEILVVVFFLIVIVAVI